MEGCIMEKWRVVDNRHETILKENFKTEQEAEKFLADLKGAII